MGQPILGTQVVVEHLPVAKMGHDKDDSLAPLHGTFNDVFIINFDDCALAGVDGSLPGEDGLADRLAGLDQACPCQSTLLGSVELGIAQSDVLN